MSKIFPETIFSEPLSCYVNVHVNVLEIKYWEIYMLAVFAFTANIAKIISVFAILEFLTILGALTRRGLCWPVKLVDLVHFYLEAKFFSA